MSGNSCILETIHEGDVNSSKKRDKKAPWDVSQRTTANDILSNTTPCYRGNTLIAR